MFPSVTTGASLLRLRYRYANGTDEVHDYFPLHSRWYPSVWNEVMEDIGFRKDTDNSEHSIRNGFLN